MYAPVTYLQRCLPRLRMPQLISLACAHSLKPISEQHSTVLVDWGIVLQELECTLEIRLRSLSVAPGLGIYYRTQPHYGGQCHVTQKDAYTYLPPTHAPP